MRERNETVYQLVLKINEIQPDQWDEVDERDYRLIDAALRRAKAEVWREAARSIRLAKSNIRVAASHCEKQAEALEGGVQPINIKSVTPLDARVAQIEEGK